jgi:hypothetical protein
MRVKILNKKRESGNIEDFLLSKYRPMARDSYLC